MHKRNISRLLPSAAGILPILIGCGVPASARTPASDGSLDASSQNSAPSSDPRPASATALKQAAPNNANSVGEIIVTANKRDESINKVGLTIKALGSAQIQQQRIMTLQDLATAVPGLNFTQTENSTPVYTLRGIGFYDTSLASYPAVSIYLDQAPLPFPVLTSLTAFDLERVEVLKGPQGTLFGNNATGGAINYIAAKPTAKDEGGLSLTYGRFNTFNAAGFMSGPLTDTLSARLSFNATDGSGWQRSISRPNDHSAAPNTFAARYLMDWKPTDKLRIQTNFNGWRDRTQPTQGQFVAFIPSFNNYIPNPLPKPLVPNAVNNARDAEWSPDHEPYANNRLLQATLRADYNVTESTILTSLTSYTNYKQDQLPEGSGLVEHRADVISDTGSIKSFSQEVRLANNAGSAFRWTIGGNYSRDAVDETDIDDSGDATAAYTPTLPAHLAETGLVPGHWRYSGASSRQIATNYAGFVNGEYTLGQFTAKGGLRYTQANRRSSMCSFAPSVDGNPEPTNSFFSELASALSGTTVTIAPGQCINLDTVTHLPGVAHAKLDEHSLSWRAGIDWKPASNFLAYANVAKGYKAGSFPTLSTATNVGYQPVTQESVLTYELGIKTQILDKRLSINATIFRSDYRDKQIKSKLFDPLFQYLLALVNVPKSRIQGAELEINARPFEGLTIGGSANYLDTKLLNTVGPDGNFLISNANVQANFARNRIPYSPKWTFAGNVNYTFRISAATQGFVGGQVLRQTKENASIGNEPILDIPAYTLLNLQAGVDFDEGRYRVMIWGKNVTNQFYLTNRNFSFDGVAQYAGEPATYGATISFHF